MFTGNTEAQREELRTSSKRETRASGKNEWKNEWKESIQPKKKCLKNMFIKYPKIHRLGAEETDGILIGECSIQEKVDGANTSIWNENGNLHCASRSQEITGGFNGFVDYAKNHVGINQLLLDSPEFRLYGEWLVRHTIAYRETSYRKFYLFDILVTDGVKENGEWLSQEKVKEIAERYGIDTPKLFAKIENPSLEEIKEFVGVSSLGDKGEGVVIKNFDFVNKFGSIEYAKIVTESFKEDNAVVFGGNNKHSDSYWEMYVCNKYMSLARVQKVMNKIQPTVDEKLGLKHIPRILGTCYHDLITEEVWEIARKVPTINFKVLQRVCYKKARQIYVDILNESISVADL